MLAVQATLQPNFFFSFVLVVSYKTFKLGFGSFLFLQKYYKYSLAKLEWHKALFSFGSYEKGKTWKANAFVNALFALSLFILARRLSAYIR